LAVNQQLSNTQNFSHVPALLPVPVLEADTVGSRRFGDVVGTRTGCDRHQLACFTQSGSANQSAEIIPDLLRYEFCSGLPDLASNYTIESRGSLQADSWVPVNITSNVIGNYIIVGVPFSPSNRFFRLRQ